MAYTTYLESYAGSYLAFACDEGCCQVGMDTDLPPPDDESVEIRPMYQVLDEQCPDPSEDEDSCGCVIGLVAASERLCPSRNAAEYVARIEMAFFAALREEEAAGGYLF